MIKNYTDSVLKQFDKQIKNELIYNKGDLNKCPSYWSKRLFVETKKFNSYNWKIIQTDSYLSKKDYYQRIINNSDDFFKKQKELINQLKFMYNSVMEHKKRITQINGKMYYDLP